jgi:SAM-dependent methyltransferase
VVHSEDVDYEPYFKNVFTVTKNMNKPADMHVDLFYENISKIDDESFEIILCCGLLEHVPDPQRLIDNFHRILKPGGELIISASAVFSFHEGPNNFFHFTPYGFGILFKKWSEFKMLRGASRPFETIGILLQRILLQCDICPLLIPVVELLALFIPLFDKGITAQYRNRSRKSEDLIDSMLPSNVQAVVVK